MDCKRLGSGRKESWDKGTYMERWSERIGKEKGKKIGRRSGETGHEKGKKGENERNKGKN